MDFGKVLSRAWQIIWTNKVLWIFGILAACGGNSGANFGGGSNYSSDTNDFQNLPPELERFFLDIQRWFERTPPDQIALYALLFVAAALVIALIFWLIGIYGRTSLIYGALQVDGGKTITFRSVWDGGFSFFGRAVGLNTILSLIPFAIVLLLVLIFGLIAVVTFGFGLFCLIPLICVLVPVFILYAVYVEIANVTLVSEGLGAMDSISRAWEVFRNNLGNLIIMGLILFVGGFIVNLIIAIPFILLSIPLIFTFATSAQEDLMRNILIGAICLVAALPVLLVLNGIVQSYLHTAWTLAYKQLGVAKKPAVRAVAAKTTPRTGKK